MRAYGSDRLEMTADGVRFLTCRTPKEGWVGRIERTATSVEHPGTAIVWGDACYEVVAAEALEEGVRYTLHPWGDAHTMRQTQTYDAATERARLEAYRDGLRRTKHRWAATLFGVITGQLPGAVQQLLANELGTNAPLLTMVSVVPQFIVAGWIGARMVEAMMQQAGGPSPTMLLFGAYLALDATIRAGFAWLTATPMGSLHGFVAYALFWAGYPDRGKLPVPITLTSGPRLPPVTVESTPHDSVMVFEPLLTLLAPQDQLRLAERYGFDPARIAMTTTVVILFFAMLGTGTALRTMVNSPRLSAAASLGVAGYLVVEQVMRLRKLRTGPAPSVLRFAIRPLVRHLLD